MNKFREYCRLYSVHSNIRAIRVERVLDITKDISIRSPQY